MTIGIDKFGLGISLLWLGKMGMVIHNCGICLTESNKTEKESDWFSGAARRCKSWGKRARRRLPFG